MANTNIPRGLKPISSSVAYNGIFKVGYISSSVIDGVTVGYNQHIFDGDAVTFDHNNVITLYGPNESKEPKFIFMRCEYIDIDGNFVKCDNWIANTKIQPGSIIKAITFSFSKKKEDENVIPN